MVSLERDGFERRQSRRDSFHHQTGRWSPVHVVADKHEDASIVVVRLHIGLDLREQALQQMVLAVYVADRVEHHAIGHARLGPRGLVRAAP